MPNSKLQDLRAVRRLLFDDMRQSLWFFAILAFLGWSAAASSENSDQLKGTTGGIYLYALIFIALLNRSLKNAHRLHAVLPVTRQARGETILLFRMVLIPGFLLAPIVILWGRQIATQPQLTVTAALFALALPTFIAFVSVLSCLPKWAWIVGFVCAVEVRREIFYLPPVPAQVLRICIYGAVIAFSLYYAPKLAVAESELPRVNRSLPWIRNRPLPLPWLYLQFAAANAVGIAAYVYVIATIVNFISAEWPSIAPPDVLLATGLPPVFALVFAGSYVAERKRFLRVLPLSTTTLAAYTLAYSVSLTALTEFALFILMRGAALQTVSEPFLINSILLGLCIGAFAPAYVVLAKRRPLDVACFYIIFIFLALTLQRDESHPLDSSRLCIEMLLLTPLLLIAGFMWLRKNVLKGSAA